MRISKDNARKIAMALDNDEMIVEIRRPHMSRHR
jgi:hypothetical protein